MLVAVTSLSDVSRWARSDGLEIVLLITGAALLTRFATWSGQRITARIDAQAEDEDASSTIAPTTTSTQTKPPGA